MFKRTHLEMNFLQLAKKRLAGNVRFDLEVQRRGVWTDEQKENLIDSLLHDYPIPPLYFIDRGNSNEKWTLDGQQRITAMAEFYEDKFEVKYDSEILVDDDGKEYDVGGLFYSELPLEVKNKLNSSNLITYNFAEISEDEITLMFKRLNAGTPFKKIELIRIDMPNELTAFVNEMSRDNFYKELISVSDRSRIHFSDQEIILQTLIVLNDEESGVSGKEIQEFVMDFELTDDVKLEFMEILEYLNKAFTVKNKNLKKTHIPTLFKLVKLAIEKETEHLDFAFFVDRFFKGLKSGGAYRNTTSSGSAKKENIKKRYEILSEKFLNQFATLEMDRIFEEERLEQFAKDKAKKEEERKAEKERKRLEKEQRALEKDKKKADPMTVSIAS